MQLGEATPTSERVHVEEDTLPSQSRVSAARRPLTIVVGGVERDEPELCKLLSYEHNIHVPEVCTHLPLHTLYGAPAKLLVSGDIHSSLLASLTHPHLKLDLHNRRYRLALSLKGHLEVS